MRSFALNSLRSRGVTHIAEALYDNAVHFDRILRYVGGHSGALNSPDSSFSKFRLTGQKGLNANASCLLDARLIKIALHS